MTVSFPKIIRRRLPRRIASEKIDAAKGMLILLLLLGHASNFWTPEPYPTFSIKFFHVACFLLLPFIYDTKPLNLNFLRNRLVRYYIPFCAATLTYGILYSFAISHEFSLLTITKALLIGNAPQLDNATGLRALWFMPALITIIALSALLIGRLRIPLITLVPLTFLVHISVGLIPEPLKFQIPFGLISALYLFGLGLIIRIIYTHINHALLEKTAPLALIIAIAAIIVTSTTGSIIKFPVIHLPDLTNPSAILLHDIIILGMFIALISNKYLQRSNTLQWIGQNSLTIYLSHLLFLGGTMIAFKPLINASKITPASTLTVAAIFTITLSGSILCTRIINACPNLKSWIMPKDWKTWPLSR